MCADKALTLLVNGLIGSSNTTKHLKTIWCRSFFIEIDKKMSKKTVLIQMLKTTYRYHRDGHPMLRKKRLWTMYRIVEELKKAGCLPFSWQGLKKKHIEDLIVWWRHSGLSVSTIMNRLSVLRHFMQFIHVAGVVPSNHAMGLIKYRLNKKRVSLFTKGILNIIHQPIVKMIVTFEIHFGLTKKEIISLITRHHIFDDKIQMSRNIAFNHKERSIPIATTAQIVAINGWRATVPDDQSLLNLYSYHAIMSIYRFELKQLDMKSSIQYRPLYAVSRYSQLVEKYTSSESLNKLQLEMGISSDQIRKYLRGQQ